MSADHRNPREAISPRRSSGNVDFTYAGINATFTAAYSLYPEVKGAPLRCAEIFLNTDRSQGDLEANVRDAGILASFALQHGATIEALVAAVTHEEDGSCSSLVGKALNLVKAAIDEIPRDADPEAGVVPPMPGGSGDGGGSAELPSSPHLRMWLQPRHRIYDRQPASQDEADLPCDVEPSA